MKKILTPDRAKKAMAAYATAVTALTAAYNVTAFATTGDATGESIMRAIIDILLTISRYVGIVLIGVAIYELVISFTQQQPEAKIKGIQMAVVGAILFGLKSLFDNILPI